jgi:hypothetical protein
MEARGRRPTRARKGGEIGYLIRVFTNTQIVSDAGISQDKTGRIVAMLKKVEAQVAGVKEKIKAEYKIYRQALQANPADANKAMGAAKRIHNLRWEIRELTLGARLKILGMFNAEERGKFDNAIKKFRNERRNRQR